MCASKITTKTPAEIAAAFAAVCADLRPLTAPKVVTAADRLAPYRIEVMKLRRRGLSWRQISQAMADPRIGEKVSPKLLQKVFSARSKSAPAATPVAPTPTAPAAKPQPPRLIVDPLTGKPSILPPPGAEAH
jgi:hypothetical protein